MDYACCSLTEDLLYHLPITMRLSAEIYFPKGITSTFWSKLIDIGTVLRPITAKLCIACEAMVAPSAVLSSSH